MRAVALLKKYAENEKRCVYRCGSLRKWRKLLKTINLDNDWEFEYRATRKNAATGTLEPATGLTGLNGRLSATDAGAAIDPLLSVSLSERGSTGIYYGVVQGDDLRSKLVGYVGTTVYEVFGDGTNVFTSIQRFVAAVRRP